jgi:hypothetical protein
MPVHEGPKTRVESSKPRAHTKAAGVGWRLSDCGGASDFLIVAHMAELGSG